MGWQLSRPPHALGRIDRTGRSGFRLAQSAPSPLEIERTWNRRDASATRSGSNALSSTPDKPWHRHPSAGAGARLLVPRTAVTRPRRTPPYDQQTAGSILARAAVIPAPPLFPSRSSPRPRIFGILPNRILKQLKCLSSLIRELPELFKTIERFTTLLFQHSIRQYATYLYLHNESKLFFSRQCEDTFAWFAPLEAERKRVRTLASSVAGRNEACRQKTVPRTYISQ